MDGYIRFRLRRRLRRLRRSTRSLRAGSIKYFHRHIWGKWTQLGIIRRFVLTWWGIVLIGFMATLAQQRDLSQYYLTKGPAGGGRFSQGLVGEVKNLNPILPESAASVDISRLIFSGLTRYNGRGQIEGDLAAKWEISPDNKVYTFHLRPGVKWHDGVPFDASDVAFTITAIQNPDSRSPLAPTWQGVRVEPKGPNTVVFTLPNAFSPFLHQTTVGIIPRHLLESIEPSTLAAVDFNQQPVGTGPFKIDNLASDGRQVQLEANSDYYAGRPRLDGFNFELFDQSSEVLEAYAKRRVDGVGQLTNLDLAEVSNLPNLRLFELGQASQTNLFFKTTSPKLAELKLRQALIYATSRQELVQDVLLNHAVAVAEPILPNQLGYDPRFRQSGYLPGEAVRLLDELGWTKQADGSRKRDGQKLTFQLVTLDSPEYQQVAERIRLQWQKLGIDLEIHRVDLDSLQQSYIRPRQYDLLLFGINLGADPDVYGFWHSSQSRDPGLNLSQYQSGTADAALESGRLSSDEVVRRGKYATFLQAWQADAPAVILFSPYYTYGVSADAHGITTNRLIDPSDRFYNVEKWTIQTKPVRKLDVLDQD